MFDYGLFKFESKQELFDKAIRYWNPDKTKFWQNAGIDLVIDRREGYFLYDMSGRRLIDLHLNGGTYNLRNDNTNTLVGISVGTGGISGGSAVATTLFLDGVNSAGVNNSRRGLTAACTANDRGASSGARSGKSYAVSARGTTFVS